MSRKITTEPIKKEDTKEILPKSKTPLVFISHDTRDAELAEEFGNLLRSASTGALKSFRSSDKKATQGIEYGSEWFPAIMEKIDEATDVVCLLTPHSVDRPWILYEAGVAKGKLNTKVIGIALGIPLSSAIKGPFAQFQNLDDDLNSLTKLVFELVKKVPGLDPDEHTVKFQVEAFKKKIAEVISKNSKATVEEPKKENVEETSVAKLFEEIKIMFQDLPSRIDRNILDNGSKRLSKFHPMMLDEVIHMTKDHNIGFLMALGFFKNDMPWLYDLGVETLRKIREAKSVKGKEMAAMDFQRVLEISIHNPYFEKTMMRNEYNHRMLRELTNILEKALHGLIKK